jgi:hypothetical protein
LKFDDLGCWTIAAAFFVEVLAAVVLAQSPTPFAGPRGLDVCTRYGA